ncbi:MAG TPA: CDP-diacylglycerol--glycerol-3-phosphate 3-phosphatidyltransferase [Candidatus Kapabacteria bacterium]|nr:CDP-diacylglycerol--glycerol-3-phosphate 3-phosphatidyltransferase [Candidatus Kapabacteria bacterium]
MWTLANQITFLRILLTPVFVVLMLSGQNALVQWALIVYVIAAVTDFYDGYVARRMGGESRFGKFLDPLADKFLTVAAFVCFIYLDLIPLWMVVIVVSRDIIVTFLRMYAEWKDKPIVTMKSAKWKTFFQLVFIFYTLALLAAAHTVWIRRDFGDFINMLLNPVVMQIAMLGLTLLTVITGVIYLIENRFIFRPIATERSSNPIKP